MNFEPNTITTKIDEKSIGNAIKDITVGCEVRQENGVTTFTHYKYHLMTSFTITPEKQNGFVTKLRFKYCSGDQTCFNDFFVSVKNKIADKPPANLFVNNKLTLDDDTWACIRSKCESDNSEKKALGFAQLGLAAQNDENYEFLAAKILELSNLVDHNDPFSAWSFVFALKRTWHLIGWKAEYRHVSLLDCLYRVLPPGKARDVLGQMVFSCLNHDKIFPAPEWM